MICLTKIIRRFFNCTINRLAFAQRNIKHESTEETCLSLEDRTEVKPTGGCPKVLIVGGGMAGLSAAERLISAGISSISIIEGTERLGGRMMSLWIGDTSVELGCKGITGGTNITNPLFGLALAVGDGDIDKIFKEERQQPTFFLTSEGKIINDFSAEELLFAYILKEATNLGVDKTSVLHFLSLRINQELLNYPEEERYNAERLLYGMVNELRDTLGCHLSNVSTSLLNLRKSIPGRVATVSKGMLTLLIPLTQKLPPQCIQFSKEVTKIEWSATPNANEPRVIVRTADYESYCGDYVIITLPFGVLKAKAAEMFSPPLPCAKLNALNSIGCGVRNQIYAEYNEPWWGGSGCRIRLALSPKEILQENNWTRGITNIESSSRTVMQITTNGPDSLILEKSSEEQIASEMTRFFRRILCDETIPFPYHIIVTRWGTSNFCRGSHLSLTIDSSEDHLAEFSIPVPEDSCPVLLFAGEATTPSHFATVEGARISGIREADRILKLTRQFDGPPK